MPSQNLPEPSQPPPVLYKYYSPERLRIFQEPSIRFTMPTEFNDVFDSYSADVRVGGIRLRPPRETLGIFCMTQSPEDHLMWVHYAAQHTGFVIGFDTRADIFKADEAVLDSVEYKPMPSPSPTGVRHCFNKGAEWINEREWRCVRQFKEGELRDISIPKAAIKEVIVGYAMKPYHVVEILRSLQNGFTFLPTITHADKIDRKIRKYTMTAKSVRHATGTD